tara:strand:- start:1836 stop:2213 length:378 start_codon:yes stop_codon:yes gene_type:complete
MILTEDKHLRLCELLENVPESNWDAIEDAIKEQQTKELEIFVYLQKLYEDDKFCLIASFTNGTDECLDFIEFTDKRNETSRIKIIWDNDRWWNGLLENTKESIAQLDAELLPIVQQFLKQILNRK